MPSASTSARINGYYWCRTSPQEDFKLFKISITDAGQVIKKLDEESFAYHLNEFMNVYPQATFVLIRKPSNS